MITSLVILPLIVEPFLVAELETIMVMNRGTAFTLQMMKFTFRAVIVKVADPELPL